MRVERLALLGGKPVRETPFPTWSSYQSDEEAESVLAALRSDHLFCAAAGGETIPRLEAEFVSWCGAAGAVRPILGFLPTMSLWRPFVNLGGVPDGSAGSEPEDGGAARGVSRAGHMTVSTGREPKASKRTPALRRWLLSNGGSCSCPGQSGTEGAPALRRAGDGGCGRCDAEGAGAGGFAPVMGRNFSG